MKLTCPACGAEFPLEQATQAAELLSLGKAAAAFGEDWPLVNGYLDAFRPASGRDLAVKKRLRLAREVWVWWQSGHFKFGREEYRIGREEFREVLAGVANRDLRGLTNHNYLLKALVSGAEATSRRREREQREKEQGLRDGRTGLPPAGLSLPELQGMPEDPEWLAKFHELSQAVRRPGLTPEARVAAREALEAHLRIGDNECRVK